MLSMEKHAFDSILDDSNIPTGRLSKLLNRVAGGWSRRASPLFLELAKRRSIQKFVSKILDSTKIWIGGKFD